MPIELVAPKNINGARILSSRIKSANTEVVKELADPELKSKIVSFARDVFRALDARDYGRIDIRLDKNGEPNFLEANLIPSLIDGYGSFPKACAINENIGYEQMIMQIVGLARSRIDSTLSV